MKSEIDTLLTAPPNSCFVSIPFIELSSVIMIILESLACLAIATNFDEPPTSFSKKSEQTTVSAYNQLNQYPEN